MTIVERDYGDVGIVAMAKALIAIGEEHSTK